MSPKDALHERLRRARTLLDLGRPRDAIGELHRGASDGVDTPELWLTLTSAHRALGELDTALDCARRAARAAPDDPWPHVHASEILLALDQVPRAIEAAERATSLGPEVPEGFYYLAEAYIRTARVGDARRAADMLSRLVPDAAITHDTMGRVALAEKLPAEAETHFRRALAIEPESVTTMSNLGVSLLEQRRASEAASVFWTAARANPLDGAVRMNLAMALSRLHLAGPFLIAVLAPIPLLLLNTKMAWVAPESVPFVSYYVVVWALFYAAGLLRRRKLDTTLRLHLSAQTHSRWREVIGVFTFVGVIASFFHGIYVWMWWSGGNSYAPGSSFTWVLFACFTAYVTLCWISVFTDWWRRRRSHG